MSKPLRELYEKATPGPWHVSDHENYWKVCGPSGVAFDDGSACDEYNKECSDETRALIVRLHELAPLLLEWERTFDWIEDTQENRFAAQALIDAIRGDL